MLPARSHATFLASAAAVAMAAGCAAGCATVVGADFDNLHYYLAPDAEAPVDALSPVDANPLTDARPEPDASSDARIADAGSDAIADASFPDTSDASPIGRIVFVTSSVYGAYLGGIAGADAKCQLAAGSVGLPGTFRAWLSTDLDAARDRLTHAAGPYSLVNGTVVATSWTQLTSGTLMHAIDRTELAGPPLAGTACGGAAVWTGTDIGGNHYTGYNCTAWTLTSGSVVVGLATSGANAWTASCTGMCSGTAALYCLAQ